MQILLACVATISVILAIGSWLVKRLPTSVTRDVMFTNIRTALGLNLGTLASTTGASTLRRMSFVQNSVNVISAGSSEPMLYQARQSSYSVVRSKGILNAPGLGGNCWTSETIARLTASSSVSSLAIAV